MYRAHSNFAAVYDRHVWSVYGFLAARTNSRELAEDLTQTTFERALRGWSRFDPRQASERTWLLVIARNLLIDHYRRRREEPVSDPDERLLPAVPGPEQRFSGMPELAGAIAQLSDRDQEVVALRFAADLNGPEIAEMLGLSLANVQQILSRSLRRLRSTLEATTPA